MLKTVRWIVAVGVIGFLSPAIAADYVMPAVDLPPPPLRTAEPGGWYLRGDIDYHWSKLRGTEYITYGCCAPEPGTDDFDTTKLKGAWSIGGGVGYRISDHLRTDITLDYWSRSKFRGTRPGGCGDPCGATEDSSYDAWVLLANLYADLGTWKGITPYVGAGIGGAHVNWDNFRNTLGGAPEHAGAEGWRFAWALMAGASYCLTDNTELDLGYRYTRVSGGRMFEFADNFGPGFDSGLNVHEVRAGLRWHLGAGPSGCAPAMANFSSFPAAVYK